VSFVIFHTEWKEIKKFFADKTRSREAEGEEEEQQSLPCAIAVSVTAALTE
jgi:hypothetical protein